MATVITKHERNLAAIIHASTFSKYFIPFGNFILPLILWQSNKNNYTFVNHHGKEAINFQLSLLLYSFLIGLISVPFFFGLIPHLFEGGFLDFGTIDNYNNLKIHIDGRGFEFGRLLWPLSITGLLQLAIIVINIVFTILATIRSNEGQFFNYPFSIRFIK